MWLLIALPVLTVLLLLRSAYEKRTLSVSSYRVESEKVPEAFDRYRIVFLSDLHGQTFGKDNEKLISEVSSLSPDLILLGGDMITVPRSGRKEDRVIRDIGRLEKLLDGLRTLAPVLYADGNHERRFFDEKPLYEAQKERFLSVLDAAGVPFLLNRQKTVKKGNASITVSAYSLTDEYLRKFRKTPFSSAKIEETLGKKSTDYEILLMHSPLYLHEAGGYGADLVLSGHFHGGTIRLPYLGGVMTPQYQFFNPYCKGMFVENGTTEIVSGGLGTHSINIRLNDLPDIVLITLHRRKNEH